MFERGCNTVPDILSLFGRHQLNRVAVECGEDRISWPEFARRINRVANGLIGMGIEKGDKVCVLMPTMTETVEVMFGIAKAGAVLVPLNSMVHPDSLAHMVVDSDARAMFIGPGMNEFISAYAATFEAIPDFKFITVGFERKGWISFAQLTDNSSDEDPGVRLELDDIMMIVYTSGTTGMPKGAVFDHFTRLQFALGLGIEFRIDYNSVALISTPLYTTSTWMIMLPTLVAGGTIILMPHFDPDGFLRMTLEKRPTHTFMVPTQYYVLLSYPDLNQYDIRGIYRYMLSTGAPLQKESKVDIVKRFACEFIELYGMTEGISSTLKPEHVLYKPGSVGTPVISNDLRIIDDEGRELPWGEIGEIVGYSNCLMKGYYKQPEATEQVKWIEPKTGRQFMRTGDMGRFDEEGFLYILDRKKDVIVSGGINIYADDIERILSQHPDVFDCAVIAAPDKKWGETPVALVIPRPASTTSEIALRNWLNKRLAKYQQVSMVEFRTEFPRNMLGKVLKKELRAEFWK